MGNHVVQYVEVWEGAVRTHRARCTCRWESSTQPSKQTVEDEVMRHERRIEIVRAYLSTSTPSLKNQYAYYMLKSEDQAVTPADRLLWLQLADELGRRLNNGPHQPYEELDFAQSSVTEQEQA